MRVLAVMFLLAVAAVEAWLAVQDVGTGRFVAGFTAVVLVVAAAYIGRPHRAAGP